MATQTHNVAYFNAPRNMNNIQQEAAVAEQPLLVPPQHAQQHAQAVLQQPQAALPPQYFMAPTGYPMTVPVVPSGAPQQQAYMIYPSVPQQGGMAPQQIPVQYVLQSVPVPAAQQAVPQQATQGVDIGASVSSGCSSVCERLKKFKRCCCNPRKLAIAGAIAPFVIHALFTPLSFPWFLIVWLVMALVAGVKIINKKFAAMNDDDERKQHKRLAVHTLFFATINSFLVFLNIRCCHFPWAAYPVLIWGIFFALHALRRLAPQKNTAIKKHAIVFAAVQILLFITWAYAFRGGNDRMMGGRGPMPPGPPQQQPGHGPTPAPKPTQPGQGGAAPAQGWRHGHHGGHRHHDRHGRFGGRHHHGHHGQHGQHAEPVVAHQPMEQVSTLQAPPTPAPRPPQPPQQPAPTPSSAPAPRPPQPPQQPPQQPPKRPPQTSSMTVAPPQRPRRAIPFLFYIVPSLLFTVAFLIHLRIHKKKQREAALAAAGQQESVEASAPEQTAV